MSAKIYRNVIVVSVHISAFTDMNVIASEENNGICSVNLRVFTAVDKACSYCCLSKACITAYKRFISLEELHGIIIHSRISRRNIAVSVLFHESVNVVSVLCSFVYELKISYLVHRSRRTRCKIQLGRHTVGVCLEADLICAVCICKRKGIVRICYDPSAYNVDVCYSLSSAYVEHCRACGRTRVIKSTIGKRSVYDEIVGSLIAGHAERTVEGFTARSDLKGHVFGRYVIRKLLGKGSAVYRYGRYARVRWRIEENSTVLYGNG